MQNSKTPIWFCPKKRTNDSSIYWPRCLFVEDYLAYGGESEWLEIDSDEITYFLADHQDQFDTLEIMDE